MKSIFFSEAFCVTCANKSFVLKEWIIFFLYSLSLNVLTHLSSVGLKVFHGTNQFLIVGKSCAESACTLRKKYKFLYWNLNLYWKSPHLPEAEGHYYETTTSTTTRRYLNFIGLPAKPLQWSTCSLLNLMWCNIS